MSIRAKFEFEWQEFGVRELIKVIMVGIGIVVVGVLIGTGIVLL